METIYNTRMIQNFSDATTARPTDLVSETASMLNQITDAYPMLFGQTLNPAAKAETQEAFKAFRKAFDLETIFKKYLKNDIGNDTASINDVREAAANTLMHAGLKQHEDFYRAKLAGKVNDYWDVKETYFEQMAEYFINCAQMLKKTYYTTPAVISLAHTTTRLSQQKSAQRYAAPGVRA